MVDRVAPERSDAAMGAYAPPGDTPGDLQSLA